ncbi:MAG: toprim domain-containing protein, partial [SAR324 cluster bacterium]|nr:toprim domain-containing protein [SAR324 cluster bacterium]
MPLRDLDGKLWSLQRIYPDGNKQFLKDGRSSGLIHTLGEPTPTRIIAEGFSTGASIHEATGHCVHIAFNCHNLKSVAKLIRKAHPDTDLVIAADDDWKTEENSGMTNAIEAAKSSGGRLAVPTWPDNQRGKKETDFNDLALSHGQARVKTCINRAAPPEKEEKSAEGLQASIKCLSKLNPPEYDLIRKEEAKNLGIRTSTLDKEVAKLRKKQATEDE